MLGNGMDKLLRELALIGLGLVLAVAGLIVWAFV